MTSMKIYECWPSEGFLYASFGEENKASEAERHEDRKLNEGQPIERWSEWKMVWLDEWGKEKPDVTHVASSIACSQDVVFRLWPQSTEDFERLPISINEEPWSVLRPLRWVDLYDRGTTHIEWNEYKDSGVGVGVDPLPWKGTGLILKPFRVLSRHARRHLQQHQTALRCSFQSSEVRGSPGRCGGAGGCTSLQSR